MLLLPAPTVRILVDGEFGATAQIVMLSPWPGLPSPYLPGTTDVVTEWQCCDAAQVGVITAVTIHLPCEATDPAFTVKVSTAEADIQHLLDEHGFFTA
jgi:hypothetical protein